MLKKRSCVPFSDCATVLVFLLCVFFYRILQDVQFVLQFVKYKLELQFVPVQTEEIFILAECSYKGYIFQSVPP